MAIDKRISYDVQGGVKNYLGKQKEVKAPVKWKSSPDHPETELAYITKAEKDLLVKKDLHGSLKGGVNRGPSGILSLNGFGSADSDQNVGGGDISSAETGGSGFGGTGTGPDLPPGVDRIPNKTAKDLRSAFIAAGGGQRVNPGFFDSRNTVSPTELARARNFNNPFAKQAMRNTRGGGLMGFLSSGGIMGNLIRGLGQKFGLGKTYDQPTYDMSRLSGLPFGGTAAFENLDIRDKYNRTEDDEDEEITTLPNVGSFGIMPEMKPTQYFENVPYEEPDFYSDAMAELTDKQKRFINNKKFPLQENLVSPGSVFDTITNPDLGIYDTGTFGFGEQEPTTVEEYNDYLRSLGLTQTV
jgi:hypothetical protein